MGLFLLSFLYESENTPHIWCGVIGWKLIAVFARYFWFCSSESFFIWFPTFNQVRIVNIIVTKEFGKSFYMRKGRQVENRLNRKWRKESCYGSFWSMSIRRSILNYLFTIDKQKMILELCLDFQLVAVCNVIESKWRRNRKELRQPISYQTKGRACNNL